MALRVECPGLAGYPVIEPINRWAAEIAEFAYTARQKDWMTRAFGGMYYSIQKGVWLPVNGEEINYHHIIAAAYLIEVFHVDPNALDFRSGFLPIPITKKEHLGIIHPDMGQAMHDYWKDPEAIKKAVKKHHEMARQGKIFWNNKHDAVMVTAVRKKLIPYIISNTDDPYPEDPSWRKKNGGRIQ